MKRKLWVKHAKKASLRYTYFNTFFIIKYCLSCFQGLLKSCHYHCAVYIGNSPIVCGVRTTGSKGGFAYKVYNVSYDFIALL